MDALRAELLAAFAAELAEHMAGIREALADAAAGRQVDLREFSRRTHSLKGAARAVDLPQTEAAAHEAETILLAVERGERTLDGTTLAALRSLADAIEDGARAGDGTGDTAPDAAVPSATPLPGAANAPSDRVHVAGRHVERLARSVHDLSNQVAGQDQLTEMVDALAAELADMPATLDGEVARRIARLVGATERLRRELGRQRWSLERAASEIERDAERILLLPVATLFEGHERMVRELAASQGKFAELTMEPIEAEADRRVLQALREPLLHLLRNAISHGIETPAARTRAGKPEGGSIRVTPTTDRGRLNIVIRDDGAGLDPKAIEARAREAGLIAPGAPTPSRRALYSLLFEQGFSTSRTVDEVSGRGIGLSVVAETVRRLHGRVRILPGRPTGTEIRLSLPLALARQALLLVEAGGTRHALPAANVDRVLRLTPDAFDRTEGGAVLMLDGEPLPVVELADLLGLPAGEPGDGARPALIVEGADQRRVLLVDALDDVRSLVVGDPTAVAADVPMVWGTVLLEDGVALVLEPEALLAADAAGPRRQPRVAPAARPVQRTVLVVDDSITTRTLEKSILEAQGYRVLIAVDGLAGLERLRSGMDAIDLVVADVEMPRMDGFGLLTAIRNDPALQTLPVVMMTSRNSPDDIERGLSLGANAYVTKQEFDQGTLISVVQQLV
ncbi:response regulator [Sphingomonas sp. ac-8]|uniref:hybrid sensor histidine kinase/response regulator n=1 Tax=Sphingomonas sp. ac-8 TaxID=3242977 RepID=UPI003A80EEB3